MKRFLVLISVIWLSACSTNPPKPPSYDGFPHIPINHTTPMLSTPNNPIIGTSK